MGEVSPCKENTGQVQVLGIEPFRMSNPKEPDVAQFMDQCKQARSMLGCWVEMVKCDGVFFFVSERVKKCQRHDRGIRNYCAAYKHAAGKSQEEANKTQNRLISQSPVKPRNPLM